MNKELTAFITKKLPVFFTTNIGILVLGFILTTICGGIINEMHTRSTREREHQFELQKADLQKHQELLESLTKVIGERTFRLQRVVWLMDPPADATSDEVWLLDENAQKKLSDGWDVYYKTVADWNVSYRTYAIKIRILAGGPMAEKFILPDIESGARKAKAGTLCAIVERAHKTVADLRKKAISTSMVKLADHDLAQCEVDQLYDAGEDFVNALYQALDKKERSADPTSTDSLPSFK